MSYFLSKDSHKRNISVFLITQNLFHQGRYCRDIKLNVKYLFLSKKIRDKNRFVFLARQVYTENCTSLYKAYLEAIQRLHRYLILDLLQDLNDRLWFRTNIFPADPPLPIIYTPKRVKRVKSNYYALHVLKTPEPRLRKAIVSNCKKVIENGISECVLNVFNGNIN